MVEDLPTMMAAATSDVPAEEEALPEPELPTAQEPATKAQAALTDIQIPMWNLDEQIPIAPQVWDVDTPQVEVGVADDEVDIITLDDWEITPVVPEPPKKSPKDKKKKKRKRLAQREADGQLVIRLKNTGSTRSADAMEVDGKPDGTVKILDSATVHSAEDGAILATDVANV
jgi:hypothetical protein